MANKKAQAPKTSFISFAQLEAAHADFIAELEAAEEADRIARKIVTGRK